MIKLAHPLIEEDEQRAVAAALASGQLAQGPRAAAFERAFAEYVGVQHAVAMNSGTAALHLALEAIGLRAGDAIQFATLRSIGVPDMPIVAWDVRLRAAAQASGHPCYPLEV